MSRLKAAAKQSKWLVIAATVIKDQRMGLASRVGTASSTLGSTHAPLEVGESVAYVNTVFDDYLSYGGLEESDLEGMRVLELGPGDNFGVALRFLAAGARQVVAVDKFASHRDDSQQRHIYVALLQQLDPAGRARLAGIVDADGRVSVQPDRLRILEGVAVEEAADILEQGGFDVVVSRAVLEHLYDPDVAFSAIDQLLADGGRTLHKVDFRDHGMFTDGGMHPLTFLTVPERLYRLMSRNSGRPNRRLVDFYRAKLAALSYDGEVLVTRLVGAREEVVPHTAEPPLDGADGAAAVGLVGAIRRRLVPPFSDMSAPDLSVSGVFFVGRKGGDVAGVS